MDGIERQICKVTSARSGRASSWDRSGRNTDCVMVGAGETIVLADLPGPGLITHVYLTMIHGHPLDYRDSVVRIYWDDRKYPSVECPLGDFFLVGHATARPVDSFFASVNPGSGELFQNHALNLYLPMPFRTRARIELHNQSQRSLGGLFGRIWYHIDYESGAELDDRVGYLHAHFRRDRTTEPQNSDDRFAANLGDEHNYELLRTEGHGHIAGLHLQVDNVQGGWYGEGDDMVFVDGNEWPPAIHGTGTEEVFGGGAGPDKEYSSAYTGFHLVENRDGVPYRGRNAMYRWYVHDPIRFQSSVSMSIEHGHANDFANDYASVVYYYLAEPSRLPSAISSIDQRRPRMSEKQQEAVKQYELVASDFVPVWQTIFSEGPIPEGLIGVQAILVRGDERYHKRDYDAAIALYKSAHELLNAGGML